jgi:hypothetical protein
VLSIILQSIPRVEENATFIFERHLRAVIPAQSIFKSLSDVTRRDLLVRSGAAFANTPMRL